MKKVLEKLFAHDTLSRKQAHDILMEIGAGKHSESQVTAFLAVFNMRSITIDELKGFRDAMLEMAVQVDLEAYDPIDLCGTGGDGKNTFNISTLASFVTAGAGYPVAKHGNYGVSSTSGSSNVMEKLGFRFSNQPEHCQEQIDQCGICFLHAPLFHPAMKNVAGIRRELGLKTFFNMLGPLVNPARPKKQSVGVFNLALARRYYYLFQQEEGKKFSILHDHAGYDEISLTDTVRIYSHQGTADVNPDSYLTVMDIGDKFLDEKRLHGGDSVDQAADIFIDVLQAKGSHEQHAVVIANAAQAIFTASELNLAQSIKRASESLHSGKAYEVFNDLINLSKRQ